MIRVFVTSLKLQHLKTKVTPLPTCLLSSLKWRCIPFTDWWEPFTCFACSQHLPYYITWCDWCRIIQAHCSQLLFTSQCTSLCHTNSQVNKFSVVIFSVVTVVTVVTVVSFCSFSCLHGCVQPSDLSN